MTELGNPTILANFKKAFESDGFKSDARSLLMVDDDRFSTLVAQLQVAPVILGSVRLQEEIAKAGIADEGQVRLLTRIIPIFARWGRTAAHGKVDSFVATLHAALASEFSEAELANLAKRFVAMLLGEFPGLKLADKTEAVARATGRELRSVRLITDVRPVFDDGRERVLAVVPMTTLKLTTESLEDGVPASTWEVQLSEWELVDLSTKIAEAQQKLAVMKKLLCDKDIEIADCTMVLRDGDEQ